MTNVKSLLALYLKMGGSLTDTYSDIAGGVPVGQYSTISDAILACSKKYSSGGGGLPADFPAEGIANANKFLGFDNSGDYATLDAPSGLPAYTASNNGQVLGVDDGAAAWVNVPSVFEVVLTVSGDTITGDKTFGEVAEAYFAGNTVRCNIYVDNAVKASSTVINVDGTAGTGYSVTLPIGATVTEITGDSSDYISATLGS